MKYNQLTLTEIAKQLKQPQHRLIYLCEKSVVVPDGTDAKGRGSSRRFSSRNLFEFSVALTLSEFNVPANLSKKILSTIRLFEKEVKKSISDFQLPQSLADSKAPEISIVLTSGAHLSFVLGFVGQSIKLVGSVNLIERTQNINLTVTEFKFENRAELFNQPAWIPNDANYAYFLLNLTKIARNLKSALLS